MGAGTGEVFALPQEPGGAYDGVSGVEAESRRIMLNFNERYINGDDLDNTDIIEYAMAAESWLRGERSLQPDGTYAYVGRSLPQGFVHPRDIDMATREIPDRSQTLGLDAATARQARDELLNIETLLTQIDGYRTLLSTTGPQFSIGFGFLESPETRQLRTAYTSLQLALKDGFELGVLSQSDIERLEAIITDPVSVEAGLMSVEQFLAQVDQVRDEIVRKQEITLRRYGLDENGEQQQNRPLSPGQAAHPLLDLEPIR